MKYFKILLIIGVLLGGVVASVVEVPSYAAGSTIIIQRGEEFFYYFPSTGYVVENLCYYGGSVVGKYVLPKNLSLSKLKNLKGNFPGVHMNMIGGNEQAGKPKKWKKNWVNINMADGFEFNSSSAHTNRDVLLNYINNTKFDIIYAKGLRTYNSKLSTAQNEAYLWTTKKVPKSDCGT
jgi:hypothetical protein